MNPNSDFILTKEYQKFAEFCRACQREKYIGLCYGPPGVGKSMSASHFANWTEIYPELKKQYEYQTTNIEIDMTNANTILYVPGVHSTAIKVNRDLSNKVYYFNIMKEKFINKEDKKERFAQKNNHVEIIIIDEVDRLQPKALEAVRDIYDRGVIYPYANNLRPAVILIGMPGIEKRLVRFPQLYSRIGFVHSFKPLNEEEVMFIVENQLKNLNLELSLSDFTDKEAIATITRITQGNFRLINRLLKQSIRVMQVNQLSTISKEVVEAARECLVIGNV